MYIKFCVIKSNVQKQTIKINEKNDEIIAGDGKKQPTSLTAMLNKQSTYIKLCNFMGFNIQVIFVSQLAALHDFDSSNWKYTAVAAYG